MSLLASLLMAAAFAGVLLLLPINVDGVIIILAFSAIWFSLFFLSFPLQRRYARSLDLRRPCIRFAGRLLSIPVTDSLTLHFNLDEPCHLLFGWYEVVTRSAGGPTSNTRAFMTYAIISQAGQQLFLKAEESVREARAAGWPNATSAGTPALGVRLWANDLVVLVETLRAQTLPVNHQ